MSQRFGRSRVELDAFALESHRRAIAAWEEGRFDAEVAPVGGVERDEGPRPDASAEKLAALPTLPGYPEVTAGIASQISDGASAVMVASADAIERHGLTPLARIVDMIGIDSEPIEMLSGPIPATALILERNGLALSDRNEDRRQHRLHTPRPRGRSRAGGDLRGRRHGQRDADRAGLVS
jgi:acetyl-CoA C-acetyltransferase